MNFGIEDVKRLYGDRFYLMDQTNLLPKNEISPTSQSQDHQRNESSSDAPISNSNSGITWKLKPRSKVIFILHPNEWDNRELTDLLKKIVLSLQIPTDLAGFGLLPISPQLSTKDFEEMPAEFGVVFDNHLNPQSDNPLNFEGKQIFFTQTLAELTGNNDQKRSLWNFLKTIKAQLDSE